MRLAPFEANLEGQAGLLRTRSAQDIRRSCLLLISEARRLRPQIAGIEIPSAQMRFSLPVFWDLRYKSGDQT